MSSKDFDPQRLDVAAFAKLAGELGGNWPLTGFERLLETAMPQAASEDGGADQVAWHARGEARPMRSGEPQVWLHVDASTTRAMQCQRCLQAVRMPLAVDRSFLFVHGEDAAAQLDADSEDDVLAITRALDLHELVEDELLLAEPIVPRHEVCPEPLPLPEEPEAFEAEAPNPFAALAGLKKTGPPN